MYRKIFAFILALLIAGSSYAEEYTPGDVIVVLKPSEKSEISASALSLQASEFAATFFPDASVSEFYPALSEKSGGAFMMLHSDSMDAEEFSSLLKSNSNIAAASPNYTVHAAIIPDDNYYGECWGMEYINAPDAWDITTGEDDIYVAIIDSGIDHTNPDLTDNIAINLGYNTFDNGTTNGMDDYGHGTHVAGTIGALGNNDIGVAGLNWNVKMISVKALNASGNGSFATVIAAVDYVTSLINRGYNIRAVNLSLETYLKRTPTHEEMVTLPLWRAFKALDDTNKAVIVVAAGNNSETIGQPSLFGHGTMIPGAGYYVYPASFPGLDNMISVSALEASSTDVTIASFSNKGADISAPGVKILSTWLQSAESFIRGDGVSLRSAQGTSMAAPHVAGAAALLASVLPSRATAYQIKQAIILGTDLDVYASLNFLSKNFDSLSERGTEGRYYDDYDDYDLTEYNEPSGNISSGTCNGLGLGLAGVLAVMMLARKRIS